jgi:hypothetical protein
LLKKIYSFKVTVQGGVSPDTVVGIIKAGLGEVSIPYYVQESMYNILNTMVTDKGSLPIALAFLLEQAGENQNVPRWYLSGMDFPNQIPQIRLVNEKDFREAKLNQIVDISFKDESAFVILQRLASWADMELFIYKHDPSWLEREISVDMQNVKLKQALQNVASTVDGEISVNAERNSIYVQGPLHEPRPAVRKATKSSDYVGKISIPMDSGKYYIEFMLRESDLTEELKKLRADKMKEILDQLGGSGTD